jgi:hypothetical protein
MATVAGKIVKTGRQNNSQSIFSRKKDVKNSSILINFSVTEFTKLIQSILARTIKIAYFSVKKKVSQEYIE